MRKTVKQPPTLADRLLKWYCSPDVFEDLQGDLRELFFRRLEKKGPGIARLYYYLDIIKSYTVKQDNIFSGKINFIIMLNNYFKVAYRNIVNHKMYSIINISGLAMGMACCILILLYLQNEFNYDTYHQKSDRIFRVVLNYKTAIEEPKLGVQLPPTFAPALQNDYAEIEQVVRFQPKDYLVKYQDQQFYDDRFFWADEGAFIVFSWPLIAGDPLTALKEPYSLVLTESIAKKYFGEQDPIGQTIEIEKTLNFKVTAIAQDLPENSHFKFDMLGSFSTLDQLNPKLAEEWFAFNFFTYVLISDHADVIELEKQIKSHSANYIGDWEKQWNFSMKISLQPITDIHLHSNFDKEIETNGNINYIYIFSAIALFILLIACVNFMNLATARSTRRAKEVGMRKVMGAHRGLLINQFLIESSLLSLFSLVLALLLVNLLLPYFNLISGKNLTISFWENKQLLIGLLGIALFVGVIAGSYPAVILTRFRPVQVLKGILSTKRPTDGWFRKVLVIFQFSVSVILIVSTITIFLQMQHMQQKSLGFNKDQVVVLKIRGDRQVQKHYQSIKEQFKKNTRVVDATFSSGTPGKNLRTLWVHEEGSAKDEGRDMDILAIDYDFINMYGIELVAGRTFSKNFSEDATKGFILNQAAIKDLGWSPEEAIGKEFRITLDSGFIIGVVKDFHHLSPHQKITPMVLTINAGWFEYLSLKIVADDIFATMNSLEKSWKELVPGSPFDFFFLDENYDLQYGNERKLGTITSIFSLFAVMIACLGLFGLASYMAEQRSKEIGVRKVMGASISRINLLLSKEFVKLVLIASIIASPIAYMAMNQWLQGFVYKIDISPLTFIVAGVLTMLIALLTVSFQSIKAARTNPVETLRYE